MIIKIILLSHTQYANLCPCFLFLDFLTLAILFTKIPNKLSNFQQLWEMIFICGTLFIMFTSQNYSKLWTILYSIAESFTSRLPLKYSTGYFLITYAES